MVPSDRVDPSSWGRDQLLEYPRADGRVVCPQHDVLRHLERDPLLTISLILRQIFQYIAAEDHFADVVQQGGGEHLIDIVDVQGCDQKVGRYGNRHGMPPGIARGNSIAGNRFS